VPLVRGSSAFDGAPWTPRRCRTPRIVPEIGRSDVREVFLRTYRIVYRVLDEGIVVLTVVEGHRLLGELDPDSDA
jgi:hypothetical protein